MSLYQVIKNGKEVIAEFTNREQAEREASALNIFWFHLGISQYRVIEFLYI